MKGPKKNFEPRRFMTSKTGDVPSPLRETRGSGSDARSDCSKLRSREALLDKMDEDSFPASDPPTLTPVTGIGHCQSK